MDNKQAIIDMIVNAYRNKDHTITWWHTLEIKNSKRWGIVVAWMNYDRDPDDWGLYAKIAYLPTNTLMSEYDIDWIIPGDDDGLWTEEIQVSESSAKSDTEWLLKEWDYVKQKGNL